MSYERSPLTQATKDPEIDPILLEQAQIRQRFEEMQSPLQLLGNMVVGAAIGGALGSGTLMPRTEAVTLEIIAGTTKYGESIQDQQKLAA